MISLKLVKARDIWLDHYPDKYMCWQQNNILINLQFRSIFVTWIMYDLQWSPITFRDSKDISNFEALYVNQNADVFCIKNAISNLMIPYGGKWNNVHYQVKPYVCGVTKIITWLAWVLQKWYSKNIGLTIRPHSYSKLLRTATYCKLMQLAVDNPYN